MDKRRGGGRRMIPDFAQRSVEANLHKSTIGYLYDLHSLERCTKDDNMTYEWLKRDEMNVYELVKHITIKKWVGGLEEDWRSIE